MYRIERVGSVEPYGLADERLWEQGLIAGVAQRFCQRGRKLSIDEKKQNLFRRDDGMVQLTGGKGQSRIDVGAFEIGILLKDHLS
jgi:hypothetical protein